MIAERPGGVSPSEPSKGSESLKAQREQAQKVEKVREIDADEETQRRKRKFQMMMGDEDQLEGADKSTRAPSPFEIEFYRAQEGTEAPAATTFLSGSVVSQDAGLEEVDAAAVPSPSYSPPPTVNAPPPKRRSRLPFPAPTPFGRMQTPLRPPNTPSSMKLRTHKAEPIRQTFKNKSRGSKEKRGSQAL